MTKKAEFEKQLDEVKTQIRAIQEGVCELRKTGIRENVIYLLIQKASPNIGRLGGQPVSASTIKAVMKGIDGLYDYVFPPKKVVE